MYEFTHITRPFNINIFKFSGDIKDKEFKLYKKDFDNLLNQKNSFYVIFNLLEINKFNINFFIKQMNYMYTKEKVVKKYLKASVILTNGYYKTLIKISLSMKKPINQIVGLGK